MRIFYLIFFLILGFSTASFGQEREDYEVQSSRMEGKNVQIFPNPAVDFVHIRFESIPAKNLTLTVHNIIGNQVPSETEIVDEYEVRIRVKDFVAGYYLVAVKDEENHFRGTYKFLKR